MAMDLITAWLSNDMVTADRLINRMSNDELKDLFHKLAALAERIDEELGERPVTSAASSSSLARPKRGRYQVRGPHGTSRDQARWTVVDTTDRNIAVHASRTKADATATARELNARPATPL
jgi:hypothetical protein